MATLWITEYESMANVGGGIAQVPKEPAVTTQAVTYSSSTASAAFNAKTTLIGVRASALAHLNFGLTPVATALMPPISSGETRYFGVNPGDKVAAYDGTT